MSDFAEVFDRIVQKALLDMALVQCSVEEFEAGLADAIREMQRVLEQSREVRRYQRGDHDRAGNG